MPLELIREAAIFHYFPTHSNQHCSCHESTKRPMAGTVEEQRKVTYLMGLWWQLPLSPGTAVE